MSKQERKAIIEAISEELIKSEGETTDAAIRLVNGLYNSISMDISEAIGEADDFSAPFIISALERYAKKLRNLFPNTSTVVEWIDKLNFMEVTETKKEDSKNE